MNGNGASFGKRFLEHLTERWYVYVLWAVFAVITCIWIFSMVTSAGKAKKITVFVSGYECNVKGLHDKLSEELPQGIEEIAVRYALVSDVNYGVYYSTVALVDSDIIILPESRVFGDDCEAKFCALSLALAREYFGENEYYFVGGNAYGIRVYDKTTGSGACKDYITYSRAGNAEENYWLFFNKSSMHLGEFAGSESNSAVTVAKRLLSL